MEKLLGNASKDYHMGLRYNEIHFKCLVSLFDILMDQKKFVEAYDIVKKIADYFPKELSRRGSVIHLAVITKNYEDMENIIRYSLHLTNETMN